MANMTLSTMSMRTNYMMAAMREKAIADTWKKFVEADAHYYRTSEGGDKVAKLIHELIELGVDEEAIFDKDLDIRDAEAEA